ncbi:YHYH domain-containing protein [Pseudomonas aeruginosa]|nr:YHYH domain-containing protein [Pseudomonas aeruginosa]MEC6484441.1 YHYH domain-containing protein [Pseudomonas aeruginosa]NPT01248.1 YHYH domain-containing protein [Pseudomonas aeruginosa]QKE96199.1 YHYH domain-containing protein [Pseudomonas aeruginosa]HBO1303760.1 YHYH domain-containing protein [Pseudomonas aeruginosa]HBO6774064.1 YHYH domain-containing protein [Pseudomonas aeruginosa]
MKKLSAALVVAVIALVSTITFAHSGGTDSKGCHINHSNGVYHCH